MIICEYCGNSYEREYCICVGAQLQRFYVKFIQDDVKKMMCLHVIRLGEKILQKLEEHDNKK